MAVVLNFAINNFLTYEIPTITTRNSTQLPHGKVRDVENNCDDLNLIFYSADSTHFLFLFVVMLFSAFLAFGGVFSSSDVGLDRFRTEKLAFDVARALFGPVLAEPVDSGNNRFQVLLRYGQRRRQPVQSNVDLRHCPAPVCVLINARRWFAAKELAVDVVLQNDACRARVVRLPM